MKQLEASLDSKLRDFIVVDNMLDKSICEETVDLLERCVWDSHGWQNGRDGEVEHKKDDPEVIFLGQSETNDTFMRQIMAHTKQTIINRMATFDNPVVNASQLVSGGTDIRYNRYQNGQHMRPHKDHIRSAFQGHPTQVGIPILSVLSVFNEDYEGGEFCFWGEPVDLKTGDVLIFPSVFLFSHEVRPVTQGARYTGIFWIW